MMKISGPRMIAIFWLWLGAILCWWSPAWALNEAQVAIYNDLSAPVGQRGGWQDGLTAIESMLTWAGLTYEEITYNDLNNSTQNFSDLYKVMIFPGGYAYYYNYWISEAGKTRIRNFVSNGGGYLGICAGAYFASDKVTWNGLTYDDSFMTNAYDESTGYDLDLLSGTAIGPLDGIANYAADQYNMSTFNFSGSNDVLSGYKSTPYPEDILYYGGPYFSIGSGPNVQTLATYEYNGQPGIVATTYQSGKVVLFGPHPEIEEDSSRDGTSFGKSLDDNDSDWRLLRYVLSYLGATSSSESGSYSRYDFNYYFNDGSGDYYRGYVYAPTSFQTSGPVLQVGQMLYNEPEPMGGAALGGYYYITGITDGYDSSYDKQSYITFYYDASSQSTIDVNTSTTLLSYVNGHIHVNDRTSSDEGGYAINGASYAYFTPYISVNVSTAASAGAASPPVLTSASSQAAWGAYFRQTNSLLEEDE